MSHYIEMLAIQDEDWRNSLEKAIEGDLDKLVAMSVVDIETLLRVSLPVATEMHMKIQTITNSLNFFMPHSNVRQGAWRQNQMRQQGNMSARVEAIQRELGNQ